MRPALVVTSLLAAVFPAFSGATEPATSSPEQNMAVPSTPTVSTLPATLRPTPPPSPRLRFGIGFLSGATEITQSEVEPAPGPIGTALGLDFRAGVQINDWLAIMTQGSATLFWPDVRAALLGELTPIQFVSLGIGFGLDWFGGTTGAGPQSSTNLGVPLRVAFNIPVEVGQHDSRRAVSISFEAIPEAVIGGRLASGFEVGMFAGVGYEIY